MVIIEGTSDHSLNYSHLHDINLLSRFSQTRRSLEASPLMGLMHHPISTMVSNTQKVRNIVPTPPCLRLIHFIISCCRSLGPLINSCKLQLINNINLTPSMGKDPKDRAFYSCFLSSPAQAMVRPRRSANNANPDTKGNMINAGDNNSSFGDMPSKTRYPITARHPSHRLPRHKQQQHQHPNCLAGSHKFN